MRPIPSASAMSVTVAPEASAFAIPASRPSRRSSAPGGGAAGSLCVFEAFRGFTRARRVRLCVQSPRDERSRNQRHMYGMGVWQRCSISGGMSGVNVSRQVMWVSIKRETALDGTPANWSREASIPCRRILIKHGALPE